MNRGDRGSAFILLLIGIGLLAALAYTMTRTGRMGAGGTQEKTAFAAAAIMRYGDDLHGAVQTILGNGYDVSQLSFRDVADLGANYSNAADSTATRVFDPPSGTPGSGAGGGMKYLTPDASWLDSAQSAQPFYGKWYFPRNVCVPFVGTGADGSSVTAKICNDDAAYGGKANEVVMVLPYVSSTICTLIAQKLGNACSGAPCTTAAPILPAAGMEFAGTFPATIATGNLVYQSGTTLDRQFSSCVQSAGRYYYYRVLAER